MLESLLADIRFAVRWLRKSPGFTLVAVASLAIGIGFNTALFAIVDAVLFKPLPVTAPARLVDVFTSDSTGTVEFSTSSYPDYLDLTAQNDVFDGLVGYSPMFAALNLDGRSRLAMGEIVTGNYFQVFGVDAALGRTILPSDDAPGAPRVVMVSHRYWARELGSAPDAVGAQPADPRALVHHRRRGARVVQRDGADSLAGDVDSGVGVARRRAGRDARRGAVADRHDAARSPRRSLAVHARAAQAGRDDRTGAREPHGAGVAARGGQSGHQQRSPHHAEARRATSTFIRRSIRWSCRSPSG